MSIFPTEFVPVEMLSVAMPEMCHLTLLSIREVSKAVLSFFKCALTVFAPINFEPYVAPMVSMTILVYY
jgi:hypothetical protein